MTSTAVVSTPKRLHKIAPMQLVTVSAKDSGVDAGLVESVVSVFGNVDAYGDRVLRGAFKGTLARWAEKGDPIPYIWSHEWRNPFAHIGGVEEAKERKDGLWIRAQLDMEQEMARQVFRLLKSRRVTNFSFAYDILDGAYSDAEEDQGKGFWGEGVYELKELELFECGPCLIGANRDTELLVVKARGSGAAAVKSAVASHTTGTDEDPWDGGAEELEVRQGEAVAYYSKIYAWKPGDPDQLENKSDWRFIHHRVGGDGTPGAASMVACSSAIGVLNGGRGGTTIPDADRQGVYNHLAKHLRDGDREPPELASASRVSARAQRKSGRTISAASRDELDAIHKAHEDANARLRGFLDGSDQEEEEEGKDALSAFGEALGLTP